MRQAKLERKTRETDISIILTLDGRGEISIDTGIGFFNHMLTAFSVHSGISMRLKVVGDLNVDAHHTVEDTGIVIGKALASALEKSKITRYGNASIPMDESLATCCLDISARPFLTFNAEFSDSKIGDFDTCLTEEFFRAIAVNSGMTLHINILYGKNDHHKIEAIFKAFAYAIKMAITETTEIMSTKGIL